MFKAIILFFLFSITSFASTKIFESYYIYDKSFLSEVAKHPELIVDHVTKYGFELYGPKGLGKWLDRSQVRAASLDRQFKAKVESYPTPEEIGTELQAIAKSFPNLAKVFSIGTSEEGRDLWVIKISNNVSVDDNRPEFKYIANMHGDEIVGREMMVQLIRDLTENYGKDQQITDLVNKVQIYIMPSMNPDGAASQTRYTVDHTDLNRDFPDWSTSDNVNTPDNRAKETQLVMKWQKTRKFLLSANFHGGAEVVNYPWDGVKDPHPLDQLVKSLSLEYAQMVPYIHNSTFFENGITNGWAWYEVKGGMQDWSYVYHNDLQLTIELSNNKWPVYSNVTNYYQANRPALLSFIGKVLTLKMSVR